MTPEQHRVLMKEMLKLRWPEAIPLAIFLVITAFPLNGVGIFIAGTSFGISITIHVYKCLRIAKEWTEKNNAAP
jgi:hypothetical protein